MGINIEQYRLSIGMYNAIKIKGIGLCVRSSMSLSVLGYFSYYVFLIYFLALSMSLLLILPSHDTHCSGFQSSIISHIYFPNYIYLPIYLLNFDYLQLILNTFREMPPLFYKNKLSIKYIYQTFKKIHITLGIGYSITICSVALNLVLLTICNMSLVNPGPNLSNISVIYLNVQGLVQLNTIGHKHPMLNTTKVLELQSFVDINKFDIIILNETWLKPSIRTKEILPFSNYKVFRLDRSLNTHPPDVKDPKKFKANGGGVLIAVNSDLNLNPIIVKSPCAAEMISVKLTLPDKKRFCISTCYRVGTLGESNLLEIGNRLKFVAKSKQIKYDFLVGDLNLDLIDWAHVSSNNRLQCRFLDLFADVGLTQLIDCATHSFGNMLDVLLTSCPSMISNVHVLDLNEVVKSDHSAISFDIKAKCSRLKRTPYSIYNYSKADWIALNYDLSRVNWDACLKYCDIYVAWPRFKAILQSLCEKHIPKIKVSRKNSPPWFDSDVHKLCRKKERYRKLFKSSGNPGHEAKYKQCRKDVKKVIKEKMRSNFDDDSNPSAISKKFWAYVKSSSNSSRIPDTVSQAGEVFRTVPKDKANLFNDYFCQQFSSASNYDIDIEYSNDPFYNFYIDFRDVRKMLSSLNQNKSPGPDGISGKLLKKCSSSLAYPLTLLFNLSFSQGQIPPEWKLANIVPVHKKGDKSLVENYRPISLISIIMKVFEKCIRDKLLNLCEEQIHPSQHGFLPNKSCATQLIPFVDKLALGLNNNVRTDIVYFDFAKAFDSVNHDIILKKLKNHFKVDGLMLKFLKDYLQNRKQKVIIGDGISVESNVISGVPQGSILGPLLFVLFINDLHSVVSPGTNIALYADDTKIWRQILVESDCHILNQDIVSMVTWAELNLMTFHPKKCKILSITPKIFLDFLPFQIYPYTMQGNLLDHVAEEKDLGLLVNEKINWNQHHSEILSKATNQFNLLRRTCHFVKLPSKRRTLYLTLIRSLFEHTCSIWSPNETVVSNKFEPFQKRCVKWILNEQFYSYDEPTYLGRLYNLKLMPFFYKFMFTDLKLFFRICNGLVPISLPDYIFIRSNTRAATSSNGKLYGIDIPYQKFVFSHSFFPRCVSHWNSLPPVIRASENLTDFLSSLEKYIWTKVLQSVGELEII